MLQNKKINALKNYISEWEAMEYAEFWESGCEGNIHLAELLNSFKLTDWSELKRDLRKWKDNSLLILADSLFAHGHFDHQDSAQLYGYIFTIIADNEADLLIDNIKFIDSSEDIGSELLARICEKALKVANYKNTVKSKEDFDEIFNYLKRKKETAKP